MKFKFSNSAKFLLAFTLLFICAVNIHAQVGDIDIETATYEQIHLYLIGVFTWLWGQAVKFFPALGSKFPEGLPKAAVVVIGGLAAVAVAAFQGVGSIMENLMAIFSTMGIYDLLVGIFKKKEGVSTPTA